MCNSKTRQRRLCGRDEGGTVNNNEQERKDSAFSLNSRWKLVG